MVALWEIGALTDKAFINGNYCPNPIKELSFESLWGEKHIM
jgi:Zn ribbon nucleic-acid-binding protein